MIEKHRYNNYKNSELKTALLQYCYKPKPNQMSANKETVTRYMDGFLNTDHAKILSCLTDDVIWEMPGFFHLTGKEAFAKEIENDAFVGKPNIMVTRMVEESDIVVAEGAVKSQRKDGGTLNAVFCDIFHMDNGKIRQLTSYVLVIN